MTIPRQASVTEPEWEQLAAYVSGQASPADAEALRSRIASDPAFAALAASVAKLWALPVPASEREPLTVQSAVPPADMSAAWTRLEQRLSSPVAQAPVSSLHSATTSGNRPAPTEQPRWFRRHPILSICTALAAMIIIWRVTDHLYLHPVQYYAGGTAGRVWSHSRIARQQSWLPAHMWGPIRPSCTERAHYTCSARPVS